MRFALSRPSTRAGSDAKYLAFFSIGPDKERLFAIYHIYVRLRVYRCRIRHIDDKRVTIVDKGG